MAKSSKVAAIFGAMVFSIFVSFGTAGAKETGVATGTEKTQVAENAEAAVPMASLAKMGLDIGKILKVTPYRRNLQAGIYFRYTGTPGNESNPALWEEVSGPAGCEGSQLACVVQVKPGFTTGIAPNRTIDASALTTHGYGGLMPVEPTALGNVPDPDAAGPGAELPYTSEEEIYNKN